jgi:predicted RNA-binding protein Jag
VEVVPLHIEAMIEVAIEVEATGAEEITDMMRAMSKKAPIVIEPAEEITEETVDNEAEEVMDSIVEGIMAEVEEVMEEIPFSETIRVSKNRGLTIVTTIKTKRIDEYFPFLLMTSNQF